MKVLFLNPINLYLMIIQLDFHMIYTVNNKKRLIKTSQFKDNRAFIMIVKYQILLKITSLLINL